MTSSARASRESLALQFARQWSKLPAAHFKAALEALVPQMQREHEQWMLESRQRHQREMAGLIAGFVITLISFGAAVYFGVSGRFWGTAIFSGPSLIVVVKMFVLRKEPTTADLKAVTAAMRAFGGSGIAETASRQSEVTGPQV